MHWEWFTRRAAVPSKKRHWKQVEKEKQMADENASWSDNSDSADTAVPVLKKKSPSRGKPTPAEINVR